MIQTKSRPLANRQEEKVPLRDWILLPLLSLLTIGLLAGCTEMIAWQVLPSTASSIHNCWEINPTAGPRGIPNSVCREKVPEGQLAEFKFNSCGDLAGMECGPKQPGTYRIVMVGTSVAMGLYLDRKKTIAALLPVELSRRTGRRIELYNEASFWGSPRPLSQYFNRVLAAQPDLVVWVMTPWDIGNTPYSANHQALPAEPDVTLKGDHSEGAVGRVQSFVTSSAIYRSALQRWHDDRANLLMRHLLYESQSEYVKFYLYGSMKSLAGFLRAEPTPEWQDHLQGTDACAADIEARTRAAGVPLVAVLLPNRAQAAMISMNEWPSGYDPYRLDRELRTIVTSHGGTYLEVLPDFRNIPNPEQHYLPVDGHPDAYWHSVVAGLLARELTSGAVPALTVSRQPAVIVRKGE
jgi:hypothetical protein